MLAGSMRHRLLPLALSLLLLVAQQLGALHLLAHVLHPGHQGHAEAAHRAHGGDGAGAHDPAAHAEADAGDALCQVCLVLATLGAVAGPVVWAWAVRRVRSSAPPAPAVGTPRPRGWAPYRARGPPALPAAA
jgi:hypothetical protein